MLIVVDFCRLMRNRNKRFNNIVTNGSKLKLLLIWGVDESNVTLKL